MPIWVIQVIGALLFFSINIKLMLKCLVFEDWGENQLYPTMGGFGFGVFAWLALMAGDTPRTTPAGNFLTGILAVLSASSLLVLLVNVVRRRNRTDTKLEPDHQV